MPINLAKGPYNVIFTIATFLPPASNFQFRQVSKDIREAVSRATETWIIPFVMCYMGKEVCVGRLRFADNNITSRRDVAPPAMRTRGGKAYYNALDDTEVQAVAEALIQSTMAEMAMHALYSHMPITIVVGTDNRQLSDAVECSASYLLSCLFCAANMEKLRKIRDEVDVGEQQRDEEFNAALAEMFKQSKEQVATLNRTQPRTGGGSILRNARGADVPSGKGVDVRFWLTELDKSQKPGALTYLMNGPSAFPPTFLVKHLLQVVYGVGKIKPESAANPQAITAANPLDAAERCGTWPFARIYGHGFTPLVPAFAPRVPPLFDDGPHAQLPKKYAAAAAQGRNPFPPNDMRYPLHLRTSKDLKDIFLHPDPQSRFTAGFKLPRTPLSELGGWDENGNSSTILCFHDASATATTKDPCGELLLKHMKPTDRLLVGESADGNPIDLELSKIQPWYETAMRQYRAAYATEMTKKSQRDDDDRSDLARFLFDFINMYNGSHEAKNPLFIADDTTLGFHHIPQFYAPSEFVKAAPWKTTVSAERRAAQEAKERSLNPRLLTPWILLGDAGTFSDEHCEPEGLHVHVHLFSGLKLWFVEAKNRSLFARAAQVEKGAAVSNDEIENFARRFVAGRSSYESRQNEELARLAREMGASKKVEEQRASDDRLFDANTGESTKPGQYWTMFLQTPGETVVVPPGWRHFVLNVQPSFAIARNFVG